MAKLKEECGIFGIYSPNEDMAANVYYGLIALQHRGQESCGIAVNNDKEIFHYKDEGLVVDVFNEKKLSALKGNMAIGHVRYSTAGGAGRENAQPLVLRYIKGNLAIAHNGSLLNAVELRKQYEMEGAIYQTTSDTEIIAYTIAKERVNAPSIEEAISRSMKKLVGAYSLLIMSPKKIIAAKDPWGFRPLCMGRLEDKIVFASESCALDAIGAKYERELLPGEIVIVEDGKVRTDTRNCEGKSSLCIFEHIYFARPDSLIHGQFVNAARRKTGEYLAKEHPVDADIVIGVPDSGIPAAYGYAKESGIPLEEGFIKNRYIARTFIKPDVDERRMAVKLKLNPNKQFIKGKRIIMVDDSIVRGTTCERIVDLLRDAGAKEVHVRISSPPFLWPCYFGTDIPSRDDLVSVHNTIEQTARLIHADSLGFLSMENVSKIAEDSDCNFCTGCFTGKYPIDVDKYLK